MTHRRPALILSALALLLPGTPGRTAAPPPDFGNLPAYLRALKSSPDPAARAIRREIADGPAALARERAACARAGVKTRLVQLNQTVLPAANAAPLYVEWDTLRKAKGLQLPRFAGSTWPMNARFAYTPAQDAEVRGLFEARPDYTNLLDRATDRSRCVFVTNWLKYPNVNNFTYMGALREGARTYETRGYLLAKEGRFAEALTMQARGFVIARQAADSDPDIVGFQVASAIDNITIYGMGDVLQMAGPNTDVDDKAQLVLAATSSLFLFESLRGEGAIADGTMAQLRRTSPAKFAGAFIEDTLPSSGVVTTAGRFTPAEQRMVNALCDAAEARALAQTRGLLSATALPRAARNAAFVRLFAQAKDTRDDPVRLLGAAAGPIQPLMEIAGISGKHLGDLEDAIPARHVVLAAGAAMLAAKAQTGAFPETLPNVFSDPFTDKTLGYRREGTDGFVVYSVGPNGDFDGGKPDEGLTRGQIVFRYPALPPLPLPAYALK